MSGKNGTTGRLVSINSSKGGVPKRPLLTAEVAPLGVDGDAHSDTEGHGGPDRAICIYSLELIQALRNEGHPIDVGTAGENFTVADLDWQLVIPGARLSVGAEVTLEVTSFTSPCKTIAGSFAGGRFTRISQKTFPGWSRVCARVLHPGSVSAGDAVELIL